MTGATLTCQSQLVEVKGQFRRAASPSGMSVQVVRLCGKYLHLPICLYGTYFDFFKNIFRENFLYVK